MTPGGLRRGETAPSDVFVLDSEALNQAVRGDRRMVGLLKLAAAAKPGW